MADIKNELPNFKLPDLARAHNHPSPFVILSPGGGEIYKLGSSIHLYWTGGPPLPQAVRICLIDVTAWQAVANNMPDNYANNIAIGHYQWQIPLEFDFDHRHTFQMYIQDIAQTVWVYGPIFKIAQ